MCSSWPLEQGNKHSVRRTSFYNKNIWWLEVGYSSVEIPRFPEQVKHVSYLSNMSVKLMPHAVYTTRSPKHWLRSLLNHMHHSCSYFTVFFLSDILAQKRRTKQSKYSYEVGCYCFNYFSFPHYAEWRRAYRRNCGYQTTRPSLVLYPSI